MKRSKFLLLFICLLFTSGCNKDAHNSYAEKNPPIDSLAQANDIESLSAPEITVTPSSTPTPLATSSQLSKIGEEAGKVLFPLYTNGGWGIINGLGEILVEPIHCFSTVLVNETYFISDDPVKLTTGKIYKADGTRLLAELGDLTIFGGGPDCNTPHIVRDIFLYEENGLKGLVLYDGTKLTEPRYEQVRSDYHAKFFRTLKDGKCGIATSDGELTPPVFDEYPWILGGGDSNAEVMFSYGLVNGEMTIYYGDKPVYQPKGWEYVEQIQGAVFIQDELKLTLVDNNFNPLYRFPDGVRFSSNTEGPDGPSSIAGLIPVEKDGMQGAADSFGNMVIPFGDYIISFDLEVGKVCTWSDDKKEYIDLDITATMPAEEHKYYLYYNLPETVFSQGISPYKMRLGGWSDCVTDSPEDYTSPEGLDALLRSSFDDIY